MNYPFTVDDVPAEVRVFLNHIYEYKKGIRPMILNTLNKSYLSFVVRRLENQGISYHIQEVSDSKINLFFGADACIDVISAIIDRPLNELSPEEDFMLGALLGYDLNNQCKRYCAKRNCKSCLTQVV